MKKKAISLIISIITVLTSLPLFAAAETAAPTVQSVKITSAPSNIYYTDGKDNYGGDSDFYVSLYGLEFTVLYSDQTEKNLQYDNLSWQERQKVELIDGQKTEKWETGYHKCYIKYDGVLSANFFSVLVRPNPVESIEIISVPQKEFYLGTIDYGKGITFRLHYTDGNVSKQFTLSGIAHNYFQSYINDNYVSGYTSGGFSGEQTVGENDFVLSFYGRKATVKINLMPLDIEKIELVTLPATPYDLTGAEFKAILKDGTEKNIKVTMRNESSSCDFYTNIGLIHISKSYKLDGFRMTEYSMELLGHTVNVTDLDAMSLKYMASVACDTFGGSSSFNYTGEITADNIDLLALFTAGNGWHSTENGETLKAEFNSLFGKELDLTLSNRYDPTTDTYSFCPSIGFSGETDGKPTVITKTDSGYTVKYASVVLEVSDSLIITSLKIESEPEISIKTLPEKTVYYYGEKEIAFSGMVYSYTDTDGNNGTCSGYSRDEVTYTVDDPEMSIGKHTVTLNFEGATDSFEIEVIENPIESVIITKEPDTLTFIEDYDYRKPYNGNYERYPLYPDGAKITVNYKDGTSEEIEYEYSYRNDFIITDGQENGKWAVGRHECKISYRGAVSENAFYAEVLKNPVKSIEIISVPKDIKLYSEFEYLGDGTVVKINYTDGSPSKTVTVKLKYNNDTYWFDLCVDGYELMVRAVTDDSGSTVLKAEYLGKTAAVAIEAERCTVENISIARMPDVFQSLKGAILKLTLNDGTERLVTVYDEFFDMFAGFYQNGTVLTDAGVFYISEEYTIKDGKISKYTLNNNISVSEGLEKSTLSYWSKYLIPETEFNGDVTEKNIDMLAETLNRLYRGYASSDSKIYGVELISRFKEIFGVEPDLTLSDNYNAQTGYYTYSQYEYQYAYKDDYTVIKTPDGYKVGCGSLQFTATDNLVIKSIISAPLGDITGDGKVNILDLIKLKKSAAENKQAQDMPTADLNGDGTISSLDIAELKKMILEKL